MHYQKINIKQNNINNNTFPIVDPHFTQGSAGMVTQKVFSKEMYWLLTVTIEHTPAKQNCFFKKIAVLNLHLKKLTC